MIRGLLTCKPGNTPNVGQVKTFAVFDQTSASGNVYTKIKSATPDKGGRHYMIMSVAKTDYSDQHGNLSFNLELEEAAAPVHPASQQPYPVGSGYAPVPPPPQTANGPARAVQPQPERHMDTVEQYVMRSANLYNLCLEKADTVIRDRMRARNIDLHEHPAWFQAIVSTLFINAQREGYVSHMTDKEQKPAAAKQEPY